MKIKVLTSILFLQVIVSAQQNNIDVLHYKFHIGLNDLNDTIQGAAEIKVKIPCFLCIPWFILLVTLCLI